MHMEHLLYFIEVAKCSSINQAAANLYISQPTLRAAIQSLEKEFGAKLIVSNHRGFILTDAGKVLAEEASSIEAHLNRCKHRIEQLLSSLDINIASINASVPLFSVDLISSVTKKYPNSKINIITGNADLCIDLLNQNKVCFAIVSAHEVDINSLLARLNSSKYTLNFLFEDTFLCYLNTKNPLSEKKEIYLKDLEPLTYLIPDEKNMFIERKDPIKQGAHFFQTITCYSPVSALRTVSNAWNSFAFLSSVFSLDKNSLPANICALPIVDNPLKTNHYLISPDENSLSDAEKLVKKELIRLYKKNIRYK